MSTRHTDRRRSPKGRRACAGRGEGPSDFIGRASGIPQDSPSPKIETASVSRMSSVTSAGGTSTLTSFVVAALVLLGPASASDAPAGPGDPPQVTPVPVVAPRPDLVPRLVAPASAQPGDDVGPLVRLSLRNVGTAVAPGSRDHRAGYMVDISLGRDAVVSVGFKAYSPHYAEDVLLEGGRISRTTDLAPGAAIRCPVGAVIPADASPGTYHLCAYVDPGNVIPESDERNNATCVPLRIVPVRPTGDAASGTEGPTQRRSP